MIRVLWLVVFLLPFPAAAETYLGVLTTIPNTGPGGSCCSKVRTLDQDSASVPTDGTCAGCSVITKGQFDAFVTALVKPPLVCRPGNVTSDGTNLYVCSTAGDKATQYPQTVLGAGIVITNPPKQ